MRGERIKSEPVIGWIDVRTQKKPYRLDDTQSARYKVAEFLGDHLGEWFSITEIGRLVGRKPGNVESILADLENAESPLMLVFDEDSGKRSLTAVPKGVAGLEEYFGE